MDSKNEEINLNIESLEDFDQILAGNITDLAAEIADLNESIDTVDDFNERIEENSNEITALNTTVGDMMSDLQENESRITSLETNIEVVDDFEERIGLNEDKIISLNERFDEIHDIILENDVIVGNLSEQVSNLSSSVEAMYDSFQEYDDQIESVQINLNDTNKKVDNITAAQYDLGQKVNRLEYDIHNLTWHLYEWQIEIDDQIQGKTL